MSLAARFFLSLSFFLLGLSFCRVGASVSSSSSPRLKGRVRPPGHCGPPAFYGLSRGVKVNEVLTETARKYVLELRCFGHLSSCQTY